MAVDDHGDGRVVVFQAGEVFFPEFPIEWQISHCVRVVNIVERDVNGTNLAPMWPPFKRMPKSMCIRVTSEGRIAAPGPHFMLMSCVNEVVSRNS